MIESNDIASLDSIVKAYGNNGNINASTTTEPLKEIHTMIQQSSMAQLNGDEQTKGTNAELEGQNPATIYPPDGLRAWIVVFGSFIAHFTCIGTVYSFGIFVTDYQSEFGADRATVTVAYTLSLASLFGFGVITGKLSDRYGIRSVFLVGVIIYLIALVGTSFATSLAHIIVCHGLLLGTGASFCYFPAVSVIPMWFEKRRSLAMGFAVIGSGLGSLCYSVLGQKLFVQYGWRRTLQGTAVVYGFLLIIATLCLERRLPRISKGGLFNDKAILKDRNYQIILVSSFLFQFAFMVPYAHVYAYATGIGISPTDAATASGSFGIGSAIGRFVLSGLGDYVSAVRVMRSSVFVIGIAIFVWPFCRDMPSLIAFTIIYGFFSGGFVACNPIVLADFFGTSRVGGLMAYQNLMMTPGALAGAPIAGLIYEKTGSYLGAGILGAVLLLVSAFGLFFLDLSKMIGKSKKKGITNQTSTLIKSNMNKEDTKGSNDVNVDENKFINQDKPKEVVV